MTVTDEKTGSSGGHLDYYKQHGISPVQYKTDNMRAHLERRDSLYRSLGLPPIAFKGARVLEIAPGTGQNSLYLAMCEPRSLDLVEPNPAGLAAIEKTYESFALPHTRPHIHSVRLEEFQSDNLFDVVLCENWLGNLPHERKLIEKLVSLVVPGGVMVLTIVPYIGFFPNVMRKLIGLRLVPPAMNFEAKTKVLTEAFSPHLATIANMTRSHRDWVHDCLINPHYLNVVLPLESVFDAVGTEMEALGTFPRAATDWRWFKALTGAERKFNEMLSKSLREESHNFLDYRKLWPKRAEEKNVALEATCTALHRAALAWQSAFDDNDARLADHTVDISRLLAELSPQLAEIDGELMQAMSELTAVWNAPVVTSSTVSNMKAFGALFGRETVYLSLTRRIAA
jgi:SAM-dependent methyltransferase